MKKILSSLLPLFLALAAGAAEPKPARDSFIHEQAGHHVKVWYYQPAGAGADAPIVVVMHGVGRNGEDYLNDWAPFAEQKHFLLIVPEFSKEEFPNEEGYNFGNTVTAAGAPIPREQWAFSMIEPAVDAVRTRTGNRSTAYFLFGHSAGAQFVHRFLYYMPAAHVARAVAANAGWYTMPDPATAFPYGLKGSPVSEADLRTALGRNLTVLLGTADTDPQAKALRKTPEAEAQGPYRFARGQYFFSHAQAAAAARKTPFGWSLATAPGIAHSDKGMSPFAVDLLFPAQPSTAKP